MSLKKEFKKSIKSGIGKAYWIALENQAIDFSKQIKEALLNRYCYDGQVDGHRAYYLYQIISVIKHKEEIFNFVLNKLTENHEDWYVLHQLYGVASLLAQNGDERAKKVIRNRFKKEVELSYDWKGEDAILQIDGLNGLILIARLKGERLIKNPTWVEDSILVDSFQEGNPHLDINKVLTDKSVHDESIKKYLESITSWKSSRLGEKRKEKDVNYTYVKDKLESAYFYVSSSLKKLTLDDVNKLAIDFLNEETIEKKNRYLAIFSIIKFPLDYNIIYEIVKSGNKKLLKNACKALKFFKSKEIRNFAIDQLKMNEKRTLNYLPLLVSNYKQGDFKLLVEIARKHKDEEIIHDLSHKYISIYENNQIAESIIPLEVIYNKLNCGSCRYDILTLLEKQKKLSQAILKEMQFDSYEEIRKLYEQINKKYGS